MVNEKRRGESDGHELRGRGQWTLHPSTTTRTKEGDPEGKKERHREAEGKERETERGRWKEGERRRREGEKGESNDGTRL
jgi:hypothetical protein